MNKKLANRHIFKSVDNLLKSEDVKVKKLVDILLDKKVITKADSDKIFTMEPFAQIQL